MTLTVLNLAFPFAPVGPSAVGGAEQVLTDLDQVLVARGHRSLVVACERSRTAGTLFATPNAAGEPDESARRRTRAVYRETLERVIGTESVDLIHVHGMDFYEYQYPAGIPVLVTLHMPISWYPPGVLKKYQRQVQFQCVSRDQQRTCPLELGDIPVVENGVRLRSMRAAERSGFALVLGRICPEKNQHEALLAGTRAGIPVVLGGEVFPWPEHQRYFRQRVEPLLRSTIHRFPGSLPPKRKWDLLQRAKCLLHPTRAPETSSLVAMEAMAAGTPVIAYRSGALPEIVEDGVTGFLVDSAEEMADAIGRVDSIAPQACRAHAEKYFSKERMLRSYFRLYAALTAGRERPHGCA